MIAGFVSATVLGGGRQQWLFSSISASNDVEWLERLVSDETAAESVTPPYFGVHHSRRLAYVRLGEIGSPASIAAIRRIEESAAKWRTIPDSMPTGKWEHAAPHFSGFPYEPLATVQVGERVFGVIHTPLLGATDFFLVARRNAVWTRPKLIPGPSVGRIENPALTATSERELTLTFVPLDRNQLDSLGLPPAAAGVHSRIIELRAIDRDG